LIWVTFKRLFDPFKIYKAPQCRIVWFTKINIKNILQSYLYFLIYYMVCWYPLQLAKINIFVENEKALLKPQDS